MFPALNLGLIDIVRGGNQAILIEWEPRAREKYGIAGSECPAIAVISGALGEMQEMMDAKWKTSVKGTFQGEKQDQHMSFYTGQMSDKALKVAAQHAIFQLKDCIDAGDYAYALDVCEANLDSVKALLAGTVAGWHDDNGQAPKGVGRRGKNPK